MLMQDQKPYARFYFEPKEDRAASEREGMYIAKDIAMVEVTSVGGKSVFVDEAENWLRKISESALQGRFDRQWVKDFKEMFAMFKEGEEIPEVGIPIRTSLMFSPAEQRAILNANVRTLEDLAGCTEEALQAMGPGGRALRDRARTAIAQSHEPGKVAAEVNSLKVENDDLRQKIDDLMAIMRSQGIDTEKRGPGRPRKVENE